MRTIVVSDLHGQPHLLTNALAHSEFEPGVDQLVVAGDTCDIGNATMRIHEMLFDLEAIQLIGNHEMSHMCGIDIMPYDHSIDPDYKAFVAMCLDMDMFKMAHAVDNVLITHAGLSKRLVLKGVTERGSEDTSFKVPYENGELTAELAAQILNDRIKSRIHVDPELLLIDIDPDVMWTDWFYPFWFRPFNAPDTGDPKMVGFFDGFNQIVGHTPWGSFNHKQRRIIQQAGVTMVDPYARKYAGMEGHCKYAVVEDGRVTYVCPSEERERNEGSQ